MTIENKTVLITGGATGIGFALAKQLLKKNNKVIIAGFHSDELKKAQAAEPKLITHFCDVTDDASRDQLVAWLAQEHPNLSVFINSTGIMRRPNFNGDGGWIIDQEKSADRSISKQDLSDDEKVAHNVSRGHNGAANDTKGHDQQQQTHQNQATPSASGHPSQQGSGDDILQQQGVNKDQIQQGATNEQRQANATASVSAKKVQGDEQIALRVGHVNGVANMADQLAGQQDKGNSPDKLASASYPTNGAATSPNQVAANIDDKTTIEQIKAEINTNLVAPVLLAYQLAPLLRQQPEATIALISSVAAFCPVAYSAVYCATKAGLHSFIMSLRKQLEPTNIKVIEIAPPLVNTRLAQIGVSEEHFHSVESLSPDEFAEEAMVQINNDAKEVLVGAAKEMRQQGEALFAQFNP